MPPNPRVVKAFRAMKGLGIPEGKVKPVLKNLLKLYDKNWELIEEENYRALADAIFDSEEAKEAEPNVEQNVAPEEHVHEETEVNEEPERPLKRLRKRYQEGQASASTSKSSAGTSLIKPKDEPEELPDSRPQTQDDSQRLTVLPQSKVGNSRVESQTVTCQPLDRNKGKEPILPNSLPLQEISEPSQPGTADGSLPTPPRKNHANSISHPMRLRDRGKQPVNPSNGSGEKSSVLQRSSKAVHLKEPKVEPGILLEPKENMPDSHALIKPKEEPFTGDLPQFEIPIAVIHPEPSNEDSLNGNGSSREQNGPGPSVSQAIGGKSTNNGFTASSSETRTDGDLVKDLGECLEVASTPCGKVKIALTYDLGLKRPDFIVPSLDAVLEMVKDKYEVLHPDFSVTKVMNDTCISFLELGTQSVCSLNGSIDTGVDFEESLPLVLPLPPPCNGMDDCGQSSKSVSGNTREIDEENGHDHVEQTDSQSLLAEQCQPSPERVDSLIDVIDIAKGQERVIISLVNEVNNELPPSFHYIPQNAVFQSAYVSFSLARVGDNNCCAACSGDCLSLSTPCACAHEMGGDFAYTKEGLVKEDFLKESISMNRDPEKHCQFFCKECPLERSKNEDTIEPCKGHLVRKFIKECWWKCGCNKECGNRVVQHGINRRLQVFMAPGGKGWGLRTLEDLPKGAFVCEYVGEVLTNAELFDRVSRCPKGEEHSYPVLLDADWGSEGVLKDEEALCLDATFYGNVARFINHRCFDSNLVEIPVEVETPDHHYYHLAFFTTRKVKAMEELTWDYGIDFDDIDHPVKAFRCQCGSKYCRNIKRSRRSRSSSRK